MSTADFNPTSGNKENFSQSHLSIPFFQKVRQNYMWDYPIILPNFSTESSYFKRLKCV